MDKNKELKYLQELWEFYEEDTNESLEEIILDRIDKLRKELK